MASSSCGICPGPPTLSGPSFHPRLKAPSPFVKRHPRRFGRSLFAQEWLARVRLCMFRLPFYVPDSLSPGSPHCSVVTLACKAWASLLLAALRSLSTQRPERFVSKRSLLPPKALTPLCTHSKSQIPRMARKICYQRPGRKQEISRIWGGLKQTIFNVCAASQTNYTNHPSGSSFLKLPQVILFYVIIMTNFEHTQNETK